MIGTLTGLATTILLVLGISLLALGVWHAVNSKHELQYWQLVASRGVDGEQYLDPKKLGYLLGAFGGFWLCIRMTYHQGGLSFEIFGAWLAFVGGIDVFTVIAKAKYNNPNIKKGE